MLNAFRETPDARRMGDIHNGLARAETIGAEVSSASKCYERWEKRVPVECDLADVQAVALEYLGKENVKVSSGGSHVLIIDGPIMRQAEQYRDSDNSDLSWLRGPNLSISAVRGRKVKQVYVKHLVALIRFSERLKELQSKTTNT